MTGSEQLRGAITDLADQAVLDLAALCPSVATSVGVPGYDDRLDDLTPDGWAARREWAATLRTGLLAAQPVDAAEGVARTVILERLDVELDLHDSGWAEADLNVIASPVQEMRMVFDLMPTDTDEHRDTLAARMRAVPGALTGYRRSLEYAAQRSRVVALRQVERTAEQCRAYAGSAGEAGFFSALARRVADSDSPQLTELLAAAAVADQAYGELGQFLTSELAPQAPERDGVGEQRYTLASRNFLGAQLDLQQTYEWGWQEFLAVEAELTQVAARLTAGGTPAEAAAQLDDEARYRLLGQDALRDWMQRLSDQAVTELGRTHFDIPDPLRRLDCRIAPPGGGVGAYYTGPSDDLSRAGAMWWSVEPGQEVFRTWRETTTVYHEGVPGHHLQIGTAVYRRDRLNDFQRLLAGTSGHAEGWALYAERLVRELGYLDDDGDLLGLLDSQLFRSARVVLDIGMHLELPIPDGIGFHDGQRWNAALGLEFLQTRTLTEPAYARDEIDRYLGWPGQAPSYKVGERTWLTARRAAERRHGAAFDLKAFHTEALALGSMGLDPLAELLSAL